MDARRSQRAGVRLKVAPGASVIVRARDAERTIERTLSALRSQTVPVEIILVDSGSTDGTLAIARRHCDRLLEIPPAEFTFGHALNVGAGVAAAPIHFALSAHCAPAKGDWIERSLSHYGRSEVAATGGYRAPGPAGQTGLVLQDMAQLLAYPYWGYSNTAGSWRSEVWERFRFDETVETAEDREWSWRVLGAGWAIAMDPELEVVSSHRRDQGLAHFYRRQRNESRVIARFAAGSRYTARQALGEWWNALPADGRSRTRIRASPWHIASVLGRYRGVRSKPGRRPPSSLRA